MILDKLSFPEIEEQIKTSRGCLILPVGGLEPIGDTLALGIQNRIIERIAKGIANSLSITTLPVLNYSCTTPMRAFTGSAGLKSSAFESSLRSIINDCESWGVRKIYILDGTYWAYPVLQKMHSSLRRKKRSTIAIYGFSWQRECKAALLLEKQNCVDAVGRAEYSLLSMGLYISKISECFIGPASTISINHFKKWENLGKDPQQLRKKIPTALMNNFSVQPNAGKGPEIIQMITDWYRDKMECTINDS